MLNAIGWVVVRSSREAYKQFSTAEATVGPEIDDLDDMIARADAQLFDRLEKFLADFKPPDLDWHFHRYMNHLSGMLAFSSSRNHRGIRPSAVEILRWLAENSPGSYGLVYLHDDEDEGDGSHARGRDGTDHSNEFRVWRLLNGRVDELDDPFLSPIVPNINPNEYA